MKKMNLFSPSCFFLCLKDRMRQKDQNKWEVWASILHDNAKKSGIDFVGDADNGGDANTAQKIFNIKDRVNKASKLKFTEEAWQVFKNQISPRKRKLELLKYAAIFLISLLITGSSFWIYNSPKSASNEYACITSPNGQISNVTLFDGTNIWLNAGTSLKYKQSFNHKNREVFLDGEALFSVTKNKKLPFIVHAGNAQVKVYGTEFNVKAYNNESKIETVLLEGKVQFAINEKSVMMKPGEHLLLTKESGVIEKNKVNTEEYTAWKGGKIYFNNETLINLSLQLERWYEVKIMFAEEHIKSYRFSGVINRDKSLDYILKIIQEINKIDFEFKNEQITIKDVK